MQLVRSAAMMQVAIGANVRVQSCKFHSGIVDCCSGIDDFRRQPSLPDQTAAAADDVTRRRDQARVGGASTCASNKQRVSLPMSQENPESVAHVVPLSARPAFSSGGHHGAMAQRFRQERMRQRAEAQAASDPLNRAAAEAEARAQANARDSQGNSSNVASVPPSSAKPGQ
jgi:hypothetical protein